MDPISHFLETVRNVPADRLADVLRSLHSRNSAPDVFAVNGQRERRNGNGAAPPATYDDARRFFVEVEQRRKREHTTAEAILERLHASEVATRERATRAFPSQQTVHVATLPDTTAGARFVVVNPHQRQIRVRFDVGTPMRNAAPAANIRIALLPAALDMRPGDRQIVRARLDLRGAGLRDGDRVEIAVEARAADRTLMKVWLDIEIAGPEARDG